MNAEKQPAVAGPVEPTVRQHTPGPRRQTPGPWQSKAIAWQYDGSHSLLWCDTSKGGQHWRRLDEQCNGRFTEPDALLMAAAPELLKCLHSLYHAPMGQGDYAAAGELLKRLGAA
jgi:hypothetical protein